MRRKSRLPVLLAALVVVAAALAGCGGSGPSAGRVLDQTFGSNATVNSGRLTLSLDADLHGVQGISSPMHLSLEGPFQSTGSGSLPRFDFTVRSNHQDVVGAVSTGDKGFLSFQGQAFAIPDRLFAQFRQGYLRAQQQSAAKPQAPSLQSLGIDPRRWLRAPKVAGTEQIAGVQTQHVTAGVDVPKLLADLRSVLQRTGQSSSITPAQQRHLEQSVHSAKIDVWSGKDDHRLRRLAVDVALRSGTVALALQIDDLNAPQAISAPANARPLSDLIGLFRQLTGQAPGGGAASGGASSGGASSGTSSQAYLQCVQAAGQDLKKLQRCAKLL